MYVAKKKNIILLYVKNFYIHIHNVYIIFHIIYNIYIHIYIHTYVLYNRLYTYTVKKKKGLRKKRENLLHI